MKDKAVLAVLAIMVISLSFSGCVTDESGGVDTFTVTDMAGREVEVPKEVDEVVGVEAGALRLLVYMNATDMVVGVEDFEKTDSKRPYIMAHPELQNKPSIGPIHGGDPELITSKQPDVIFWTYTEAGEADDLQEQTGIPVIVLSYGDIDDNRGTFYEALDLIGEVLGKKERAEEVQGFFDEKIADLQDRTDNILEEEKPSCYVGGIGYRGPHGIESTEPDYSPFGFVNAKNVAGDIEQEHAMIDIEQVIQWNPDKIFVDAGGYDLMMEDIDNSSALSSLDAIKDGELYAVLPYNYYTANFGTILINSYFIGKTLYPDSFEDININEEAADIYRFLVGDDVLQDMEEDFVSLGEVETDG